MLINIFYLKFQVLIHCIMKWNLKNVPYVLQYSNSVGVYQIWIVPDDCSFSKWNDFESFRIRWFKDYFSFIKFLAQLVAVGISVHLLSQLDLITKCDWRSCLKPWHFGLLAGRHFVQISTDGVTEAGQISAEEPDKVSNNEGIGRAP
jgi:hypothetical protein